MKWQLCRSILLCIMTFAPSTTQFWFQFCQTMSLLVVHFQVCWLIIVAIGLFKGFIQMFILVALKASITLMVGSPASSVDMFC